MYVVLLYVYIILVLFSCSSVSFTSTRCISFTAMSLIAVKPGGMTASVLYVLWLQAFRMRQVYRPLGCIIHLPIGFTAQHSRKHKFVSPRNIHRWKYFSRWNFVEFTFFATLIKRLFITKANHSCASLLESWALNKNSEKSFDTKTNGETFQISVSQQLGYEIIVSREYSSRESHTKNLHPRRRSCRVYESNINNKKW